jgi:hypothetical protein
MFINSSLMLALFAMIEKIVRMVRKWIGRGYHRLYFIAALKVVSIARSYSLTSPGNFLLIWMRVVEYRQQTMLKG